MGMLMGALPLVVGAGQLTRRPVMALRLAQILRLQMVGQVKRRLRGTPVLVHALGLSCLRGSGQVMAQDIVPQLGTGGVSYGNSRLQVVRVLGLVFHNDGILDLADQRLVGHLPFAVHGSRFGHDQAAGRRLVQVGLLWFEKRVLRVTHGVAVNVQLALRYGLGHRHGGGQLLGRLFRGSHDAAVRRGRGIFGFSRYTLRPLNLKINNTDYHLAQKLSINILVHINALD